jgi:hypothetical protein
MMMPEKTERKRINAAFVLGRRHVREAMHMMVLGQAKLGGRADRRTLKSALVCAQEAEASMDKAVRALAAVACEDTCGQCMKHAPQLRLCIRCHDRVCTCCMPRGRKLCLDCRVRKD